VREFAQELGSFLYQLHRLPTTDAKSSSFENAFAGSDLIFFEAEMIELLKVYQKVVPADLLQEKFDFAAKTKWSKKPVWVLGELLTQNLKVTDGKLV
ncbi:phosphotransferase, partial [Virgibacillus salexigens]|uniref:phosphotransferase n=1 Tax=Virgibacillus salexigens TaxID=61016 RepID=UPI0030813C11